MPSVVKSKLFVGFAAVLLAMVVGFGFAQMRGYAEHMNGHGHGAGHQHDMVNMPGLKGRDATAEESEELAVMFNRFEEISRSVENLPNGIRTVTFGQDEELMGVVTSHVIGMIDRVDMGRDPEVIIQSPTLDILFERRASIVTEMDITEAGIVVIQTSDDPEVVEALHVHAGEVSAMVERGMAAVHDMMAARKP
ncbi:hypothetical protein [Lentibacter sp. XHP0401]|uniref:hypothetical protein n=1 Tax=Lentibacter sp. XHP0401 TaxID=2984334 RepID=UPI0021E8A259|nr:hypothetical protein [Lentibacter sp. XHP0401]MCV2894829.1 hypothetical protein [Lentibacter sp. XHP0401]